MILVRLLSRLPLWFLYVVSDVLFVLGFYVVRYRRRLVRKNLKNAFPDKTERELLFIQRNFYRNLCDYAVEMLKLVTISREELDRRVTFTNPQLANQYLEQGQSTLNLAAHTFNWEWMLTAGSFKLKGAMDFVYQPVHSKFFNDLSLICRTRFGAYPIRRDSVAREIVKRKNVVRNVAIVGDQYPGYNHDKKFPVRFMEQDTVFFYGSVQLAVLTQYPVFYYRMKKVKRGYYEVSVVELAKPPYQSNDNEIIGHYVRALESLIRERPSEWLWSHDRWKTRHLENSSSLVKAVLVAAALALSHILPAQVPTLFMENKVSTHLNERDMAISPDGSEMYYTIQSTRNITSTIVRRIKENGHWSAPEVASFSGAFNDLEPAFSPDGTKLYFCSNRALTGDQTKDYDIWVSDRTGQGWSEPRNLGAPVNTTGNEFYPSIASNGNLYFTAERENAVGREDIFMSRLVDGKYSEPVALDSAVNSRLWEFNAFVSPDESYIIFTSYGRKDDSGGGDLYMSVRRNGQWRPAVNLRIINSAGIDYCPFVYKNVLYFTSGRHSITETRKTRLTYEGLMRWHNGATNGSDNIYSVPFEGLLKQ